MTKKLKPQPRKIVRSAGTGRFVKKQLAKTDKKGTVTETVGKVSAERKLIGGLLVLVESYCQATGISHKRAVTQITRRFAGKKAIIIWNNKM